MNNATTRAYKDFEYQIRCTLTQFKRMARKARSDANYNAKRKNFEKATSWQAMAVAYETAVDYLIRDYSWLTQYRVVLKKNKET